MDMHSHYSLIFMPNHRVSCLHNNKALPHIQRLVFGVHEALCSKEGQFNLEIEIQTLLTEVFSLNA